MKVHTLKKESTLDVSISEAWAFFSNPKNLARITPPEMKFIVLTEGLPEKIYSGLMIQYIVSPMLGIPMKWLTEIKHVQEPNYFVDEQRSGPYLLWYHRHNFKENGKKTIMTDEVHYALPFSFVGEISHSLFVRKKIESIFEYREQVISQLFK